MISADALLFGPREKLLSFNKEELPCVLQLGGNNPDKLSKAAKYGQDNGYSEINLNIGCPSNRVQNGSFGACLMETKISCRVRKSHSRELSNTSYY